MVRTITDHIEQLATINDAKTSHYYKWLLRRGTTYKDHVRPWETDSKIALMVDMAKPKQCYINSIDNMIYLSTMKYIHGWMLLRLNGGGGLPIEHAFNTINGIVLDTTSLMLHRRYDYSMPLEWFGVEIPKAFISKVISNDTYNGDSTYPCDFLRKLYLHENNLDEIRFFA